MSEHIELTENDFKEKKEKTKKPPKVKIKKQRILVKDLLQYRVI